jgi:hypothetical protein
MLSGGRDQGSKIQSRPNPLIFLNSIEFVQGLNTKSCVIARSESEIDDPNFIKASEILSP